MQWKPMKEYQAPAYLAKAATLLAATTLLNGCGNLPVTPVDPPQSSTTTQTTIQQTTTAMSGAAAIPQETTISTPPVTTTTTEAMFEGALTTPQPTTLAGDIYHTTGNDNHTGRNFPCITIHYNYDN